MRKKLKNIQEKLKNNPELQATLQKLKPQKSIWGFLGVVLFFFVPEVVNFFYASEINEWMSSMAYSHYSPDLAEKIVWITEKSFDGELSFFNIGLGFIFLWWLYK